MKKSQIRCIVGNVLIFLASILTICLFALNMVEGVGRNSIFNEITTLNTFEGANKAYYLVAGISLIVILILSSVMIILSVLGLFGGIFDIKGLNMAVANRTISIISPQNGEIHFTGTDLQIAFSRFMYIFALMRTKLSKSGMKTLKYSIVFAAPSQKISVRS